MKTKMKKFRQLNPKLSKSALSFPKGTSLLLQRPALENSAPAAESKKSALSLQDSGQKTEDRRLLFVDDKSTAAPPQLQARTPNPQEILTSRILGQPVLHRRAFCRERLRDWALQSALLWEALARSARQVWRFARSQKS